MQRVSGVTLLEAIIAIAVAALLLGVGVPAFTHTQLDARRTAAVNAFARKAWPIWNRSSWW